MGKIKKYPWYDRISLKQAFAAVMIGVCVVITVLSVAVIAFVYNQRSALRSQYDSYFIEIEVEPGITYEQQIKEITGLNGIIYNQTVLVVVVLIILVVIATAVVGGKLYYNWKIRRPIEVLISAAGRITENDLGFTVEQYSDDEFGELCNAFERMRGSMEYTNHKLWYAAEESKRLNAAFAHDLRTPLTVLKGYGELIENGIESGKISEDKIRSTVTTMNRQVQRLKKYVSGMSDVQKLEELSVVKKEYSLLEVSEELKSYVRILVKKQQLIFAMPERDRVINADMKMIAQVFGNLVSNAQRYAAGEIVITISCKDNQLAVIVADDGEGFSAAALKKAADPYYRAVREQNEHLGLGLYISSILCAKHGGKLVISNRSAGGAEILAVFSVK